MKTKIEINTDREHLDINFIYEFISNSYWGTGRTLETVQTCIQNSLNFGVYLNNQQIGYGRVVTDYGQFAYIMDIFIAPTHRGQGYSKQLMQCIMNHNALSNVKTWRLATDDAQGLYQKFGFLPLEKPENSMAFFK
jgi:GNAT superfamily N-acetyltransferase